MQLKILILLFLLGTLLTAPLYAFTLPGDDKYYEYEKDGYLYVFSEVDKVHLPKIIQANEWYKKEYDTSFSWSFDEKPTLLLASKKNQVTNAFATSIPHLKTAFFPGGHGALESFGEQSWPETLVIHETAHLYQTSAKADFPQKVKSVFGNNLYVPIVFPLSVFTFPNVLLPTSFLEGNATLNESRFGIGGRLYSGEVRAILFSLFANKKADVGYFLNNHLEFPYGREKYWLGGLFFAFLAESFSVEQANRLFIEHGNRWINPLLINKSFVRTYGFTFDSLYSKFLKKYEALAEAYQPTPVEPIAESVSPILLTKSQGKVYFNTDDGKRNRIVYKIDATTKNYKASKTQLPVGRIFNLDGTLHVAGTNTETRNGLEIIQGLLSEGHYLNRKFSDKQITDIQGEHFVGYPVNGGHIWEPKIILNDQEKGFCQSAPKLDSKGNVYCFRQVENKKVLFKNEKQIFSFEGFYAKVTDIDGEELYFIAPSSMGSTLYKWSGGQILKMFPYDNIIEAKKINDSEFVVVVADAYSYKAGFLTAKETPKKSTPHIISYEFQDHKSYSQKKTYKTNPASPLIEDKISDYSYIKNLKYNFAFPFWGYTVREVNGEEETELIGGLTFLFSDPLDRNSITLTVEKASYDRPQGFISYKNQDFRLQYELAYFYQEEVLVNSNTNELLAKYPEDLSFLKFSYPLYKRGLWSLSAALGLFHEKSFTLADTQKEEDYWDIELSLAYIDTHRLAYSPAHRFNTDLFATQFDDVQAYRANVGHSYDIGYENYITTHLTYGYSEEDKLELTDDFIVSRDPVGIPSGSLENDIAISEVLTASLNWSMALNWSYYFNYIPVGLRRLAPEVGVKYFDFKSNTSNSGLNHFTEFSYGLSAEFLLIHKMVLRFSYKKYENDTENNHSVTKALFNLNHSF